MAKMPPPASASEMTSIGLPLVAPWLLNHEDDEPGRAATADE
jgi:hypothetical protein